MSKKICHRNQCRLNQILEQVEILIDVVDELRTELNHLKKISFNKVLKKETDQEPIRFSVIYGSLKFFKNKIIKNIQSIRKTAQSLNSTKNKCVTISQQQQKVCLSQGKKKRKLLKSNRRNEYITKYSDISEKLDNSADTLFIFDASAQVDTVCSSQKDDKKSHNCNFASRNMTENNEQHSPIATINNDRFAIYSNKFGDELSKNRAKHTLLKNKIEKYRRCPCKEQCPYALYKLPCNKYRCSTPEKKVNDEISGLTLECLSFEEKKDFLRLINVDAVRNDRCFMDSSPVEIVMDESSTSSLSVDLEVDVCNDSYDLEDVNKFIKRKKTRTYILNKMNVKKDDLVKDFATENEPSFNIISSKDISKIKEKTDKIGKEVKLCQQLRHVYSEENNQRYEKFETGDFINHWPIKNNNKQIQCVIPTLTTTIFNRKISVKTSTSNFQRGGVQTYRTADKAIRNTFSKIVIPRRMRANIQIQIDKCSCLNCQQNESSTLDDYINRGTNVKETDDAVEGKKITRKRNICDICAIEKIYLFYTSDSRRHQHSLK
ncbi:uncharacterized protein LOC105829606 [Monomorium pharaonis]|uniref:uncharacterized protein LOC105829606 n=1 Tax=Monomorium pharaonis TaxID=307658 RepID=UPI0017477D25|nr:uncharacterized protein LOC105829606 [Monomorium pharaonis]